MLNIQGTIDTMFKVYIHMHAKLYPFLVFGGSGWCSLIFSMLEIYFEAATCQ